MLVFCIPNLPGVIAVAPLFSEDPTTREWHWYLWSENVFLVGPSVLAAGLALRQHWSGLIAVLAVCAYALLGYVPPLVRASEIMGFTAFISGVASLTWDRQGIAGLPFIWNVVVAPFAYALLAAFTLVAIAARRGTLTVGAADA